MIEVLHEQDTSVVVGLVRWVFYKCIFKVRAFRSLNNFVVVFWSEQSFDVVKICGLQCSIDHVPAEQVYNAKNVKRSL